MEMYLRVNTEKDNPETLIQDIEDFFEKHNKNSNPANKQSTLTNNNNTNSNICSSCGINVFDKYDKDEATKIINYCKHKYKKTLCKDCQEGKS